jgi:hypothetical protein
MNAVQNESASASRPCSSRGLRRGTGLQTPEATTIPAAYAGATRYHATNGWKVAQPQGQLPKGNWWEIFGDPNSMTGSPGFRRNQQLKVAVARLPRPGPRWMSRGRAFSRISRLRLLPAAHFAQYPLGRRPASHRPVDHLQRFYGAAGSQLRVDLWGRVRRSVESARAQARPAPMTLKRSNCDPGRSSRRLFHLASLGLGAGGSQLKHQVFSKSLDLTRNRAGRRLPPIWTSPRRRRC